MPNSITLRYDPLLLPTAQNRAGLAGLLVLRKALAVREMGPLPTYEIDRDGVISIALTKDTLQTLIDDLYDGIWEKGQGPNEPKGHVRNVTAVTKEAEPGAKPRTFWEYEQLQPKADFFRAFGMPQLWLKLWRDAVWATLRARFQTGLPFRQRADGSPTVVASEIWNTLSPGRTATPKSVELTETLFIGAQAKTGDRLPFRAAAADALLLRFWPVVAFVGQARGLKLDRGGVHEEDAGFVFSVPDVVDVTDFVEIFPAALASLDDSRSGNDFRPRDSVTSIPYEGALEYMHHLRRVAGGQSQRSELSYTATGFEVYHLKKRGKNAPVLAAGRVPASERLVRQYEQVRQYRSVLFRRQLVLNILRDDPWYHGFSRLFDCNDQQLFVGEQASYFAQNARAKLDSERFNHTREVSDMDEETRRAALAVRVRDMVQAYVRGRTEARTGITFKDIPISESDTGKKRWQYPEEWREAQAKIVQEAFLAMRSRRSRQDFAEYFTGTICSVPQYLPDADYRALAAALLRDSEEWEEVRSLAMLAISPLADI